MDKEIARLKAEVASAPRNKRGRRRYGKPLRGRIVTAARQWRAEGRSIATLSRELGIGDALLGSWLRGDASPVRRVDVMDEPPRATANSLVLRLPNGATLEGLSLDDVALLLRSSR